MSLTSLEPSLALSASERRAVGLLALVGMLRMFGLFALLPVLSLHAAGLAGATPLLAGLSVGAYGLTQALLQIPLGMLSDRIGRRTVVLAGLAVFAAGSVMAALSDSVQGVIAGRLLQGAGAISSSLSAWIADATRDEVRTRGMAVYGAGVGAAIVLAMIGGPAIAGAAGVPALFLLAAGLAVAAATAVLIVPGGSPARQSPASSGLAAVARAPLLVLDLYIFLLHGVMTAVFVALPFMLRNDLLLPLSRHWLVYVGALALSLVATVPLILADDRGRVRGTLRIALLLMVIGLIALALAPYALAPVIATVALFFAGMNFLEAALPARLSLAASEERRGAAMGAFSTAQFAGTFCGGLAGGWLLGSGQPAAVFWVAGCVVAAWLVIHSLAGEPSNTGKSAGN